VSGTAEEILALLREWDGAVDPEPLVIETSGSTGRPKRVVLSREAMRESALATLTRLGGPGRWVLNLPPTYVAGVQVLYRCVVARTEPVITDDVAAAAAPGRYVSLVPTQLVRLRASWPRLAGYDAVLVGGGPLRRSVRAEAEAAGVRVVQTYGMSETCGGCVYDGVPLDGVAVKIDQDGGVLVTGAVLFDGYDGQPDRTAASMRDGWLVTHDVGRIDHDGRLEILGRSDDVVVSGGVKVPALAIEHALAEHPAVKDVHVVGVPDEEWGERLVAVVVTSVPGPEEGLLLRELRSLVVPRSWAPRQVVRVEQMPLLANGKVDRPAVRRLAGG
jgi:o-succinylbenzoate---CoA ligase